MLEKMYELIPRTFFIIAILILIFAVWGRFIEFFGWQYSFITYSPGRLLEFSGILIIFVIAMLLRQIREELKGKN